jgi:hypothetical protein
MLCIFNAMRAQLVCKLRHACLIWLQIPAKSCLPSIALHDSVIFVCNVPRSLLMVHDDVLSCFICVAMKGLLCSAMPLLFDYVMTVFVLSKATAFVVDRVTMICGTKRNAALLFV